MRMKHLLYAGVLLLSLSACRNSLEDRAAQECKEYTEKKCPTPVVNGQYGLRTIDSYNPLLLLTCWKC